MTASFHFDDAAVQAALVDMGSTFDGQVLGQTRALYREAVQHVPWGTRNGIYDVPYGDDPRHRLDIYPPDMAHVPVVLFVHGGGFVAGDKRGDAEFYANVGRYFAAHGFLAITCNYRLAPAVTYPAGNADLAAVLAWIEQNAAAHGGDPQRIFVIGQSAGASHVAGYLFDPRFNGRNNPAIRAVALLSGFYRAKAGMLPGPQLYVGDDPALWDDRSPITHVAAGHPPLLLSVAEYDPAQIAEQTFELAIALGTADGRSPRIQWFEGHNHVSTVHGLGLGRDSVGTCLRDFFSRW